MDDMYKYFFKNQIKPSPMPGIATGVCSGLRGEPRRKAYLDCDCGDGLLMWPLSLYWLYIPMFPDVYICLLH